MKSLHQPLLPVAAILTAIGLALSSCQTQGQVINFDVPGGAGAANYSGQGAYPDPGHNYWNPIAGGGTTPATNKLSDGVTHSSITLTSSLGGTYGTQAEAKAPRQDCNNRSEYNGAALQSDTLEQCPCWHV